MSKNTHRNVGEHLAESKEYELAFAERHDYEPVEEQQKGDQGDMVRPHDGAIIEHKADVDAIKTGNLYVEFEQTNDGGETWTDSGIRLAADQCDIWAHEIGEQEVTYWFDVEELYQVLQERDFPTTLTRENVNGNRSGQRTRAYLIPLTQAAKIASEVTKPPENDIGRSILGNVADD
jgi:hypothetical protein